MSSLLVPLAFVLFLVNCEDCDSKARRVEAKQAKETIQGIYYGKDEATGLCFAYTKFGFGSGLANVPCSEEVISEIDSYEAQ